MARETIADRAARSLTVKRALVLCHCIAVRRSQGRLALCVEFEGGGGTFPTSKVRDKSAQVGKTAHTTSWAYSTWDKKINLTCLKINQFLS